MHAAALPVTAALAESLDQFDSQSGSRLERLVFNNRLRGAGAVRRPLRGAGGGGRPEADAERQLREDDPAQPSLHPELPGQPAGTARAWATRCASWSRTRTATSSTPSTSTTLKQINDELFLTPGVDRAWLKSLWTPGVRWTEVTEEGFQGGPVMPDNYDGSPAADRAAARQHRALRPGRQPGRQRLQVQHDRRAAAGPGPDHRPAHRLPRAVARHRERSATATRPQGDKAPVRIHVIGFAKLVGDLIDGLLQVALYFGLAALIAAAIIYLYTRCMRSTALVIACSLVAVVWQLGLVAALGFELDPYSILVPFLVFAIGVSHGAQKMNGIMQDIGARRAPAGRRALHLPPPVPGRPDGAAGRRGRLRGADGDRHPGDQGPGADRQHRRGRADLHQPDPAAGAAVLRRREPGGGRSAACAPTATKRAASGFNRICAVLERFTERRWALGAIAVGGGAGRRRLRRQHAPEDRRPRPGRARAAARLALQPRQRLHHRPLLAVQRHLRRDRQDRRRKAASSTRRWSRPTGWPGRCSRCPGVQTTVSLTNAVRQITAGSNEGSPKWLTIARNQDVLNYGAQQASVNNPDLFNTDCSVMPVIAYLSDHRAETLDRVVGRVGAVRRRPTTPPDRQFLLAAGSAGIEAATNIVVRKAWTADAAAGLRGGDRAVLHHLPQLARGGGGRACRWSSPRCCARR